MGEFFLRRRVLLTYELRRDENKKEKKSSSLIKMRKNWHSQAVPEEDTDKSNYVCLNNAVRTFGFHNRRRCYWISRSMHGEHERKSE